MKPVYNRILLKMSGEALMGSRPFGIDPETVVRIANEIKAIHALGVEIGIVIGAGNFCRGATLSAQGMDRVTGDQMGMLATIMNALALRDVLEHIKIPTRILSAISAHGIVDGYDRRKANYHLSKKRVVIFAGGTGNPLVTTDSAASLRGIEINADAILKATSVDGVYTADPKKDTHAERYHRLTYQEALSKELGVMDLSAFCQCRDHDKTIVVFNINKHNALLHVVTGKDEGTRVENGGKV